MKLEDDKKIVSEAVEISNEVSQNTDENKRKNNGMLVGMILLAVLAVGGIGFGVWAMVDGDSQEKQLNIQIDTLKQQNSELISKLNNSEESIGGDSMSENNINPII